MAKKKRPKMTAEELARREETTRMVEERIAYHQMKAVENGEVPAEVAQRYLALRAAAAEAAQRAGGRPTPEEEALRAETTRMLEERIAYHAAKAREEEDSRRNEDPS
jgi:hypothetical protein